jgi:hypothetical protein
MKKLRPDPSKDFTVSFGCGCVVTFLADCGFWSSRLDLGETCEDHRYREQIGARDKLIERAKQLRHEAFEDMNN